MDVVNFEKPSSRQEVYRRKLIAVYPVWEVPEMKLEEGAATLLRAMVVVQPGERLLRFVRAQRIGVCTNAVHSGTPK
jgi:hypothetical protein